MPPNAQSQNGQSQNTQAQNHQAPNGQAEPVSRIQIFRYVAKDKILDITDLLAFDPKRSKVVFTLVEFDDQNRATQRVRHFVDAADMKLVCHDLLAGLFTSFEDDKGSAYDGQQVEARVLSLRKEAKYRQPFVLRVDNGQGEVYGQGQVKMVKVTDSLTMQMHEWDVRKMALVVRDYLTAWETIHFRRCQDARTVTFTPGER